MNSPARYNTPFSMNEYAQNQCRRRATANMPGPGAHVVVNPIGWAAVVMQSGHVTAHPDSNIRGHIYASRIRIWFMLIDGRSPVDRDAAQNKAEKDRHIQPVTPPHQKMMPLGHEHAGSSSNVLVGFGSQAGSVGSLIGRNPYCFVLGDTAGAIRRILFVVSVPSGCCWSLSRWCRRQLVSLFLARLA